MIPWTKCHGDIAIVKSCIENIEEQPSDPNDSLYVQKKREEYKNEYYHL